VSSSSADQSSVFVALLRFLSFSHVLFSLLLAWRVYATKCDFHEERGGVLVNEREKRERERERENTRRSKNRARAID